jgi:flagellar hook-length control protein FliK
LETAPAPPPATPAYTEQQISAAKIGACAAFAVVKKGITLQTNGATSDDPAIVQAEAANARLSTISGGWYLKARLEKATPPDLAAAIQHLSDVLLDLGANYLAAAKDDDPPQAALKSEGNSAFARVQELCK